MTKPTEAYGQPYLTIYVFDDDSQEVRTGGTRSWRNNNPGNITLSPYSLTLGTIGDDGEMVFFPDVQTGIDAQTSLLSLNVYQKLTLAAAIAKYAPPKYNPTEKYIAHVVAETGLARNFPMAKLTPEQFMSVLVAMQAFEKYKIGDIKIIDKPGYADGDGKVLQYIWRTKNDSKTRLSHKIREGKVFSWENPPPGGHPGEDFNCRCTAAELSPKKAVYHMKPPSHPFQIQIIPGGGGGGIVI